MPTDKPRALVEINYYHAAQEYLRTLPPEHHMEATPQATQREITLASLALVRGKRSDFHVFNELLVQYPVENQKRPGQVVPDNMVVLHPEKIEAEGSYDIPLQPAGPFWVLEYVSKSSRRKDYDDNMIHYEQRLRVPYYLIFYPENHELTLFRHNGEKYVTVPPDAQQRYPLPEVEIQVALLDGWVRFWYRGELLDLPAELQEKVDRLQKQLESERRARKEAEERLELSERAREEAEANEEKERKAREEAEADRDRAEKAQSDMAAELAQLRLLLQSQQQKPTEEGTNG